MTTHARGAFSVTVAPRPGDDELWGGFGRLSIDKTFHGELDATSKGQMLAWRAGAAAYVALERVTGALHGRAGTFVLMHVGTMVADAATLVVSVAPGSGTEALAGLAGTMTIHIADGAHTYDFAYTLP